MRYFISLVLGLAAGSFSNVCILRLPRDGSLWFPRSHCPYCKHPLQIIHNIPIVSFFALRGRCYYCRASISWQYPVVELLMTVLFLMNAWRFSGSVRHLIISDVLAFYLFTLSIIDYRHRILPDELTLSLFGIGLLYSFVNPYLDGLPWINFMHSLAASLGGGILMLMLAWAGEKAFKKEALGGGDVKLIAATAAVLGWRGIMGPLLLGSLGGGSLALILIILKKKKLGETLPFGPFLSLGAYVTCLFPTLLNFP